MYEYVCGNVSSTIYVDLSCSVRESESVVVSHSSRLHVSSPPGSSVHGILQAGMLECFCHALLQGIFPTQGSNPGLLQCRQITISTTREAHEFLINQLLFLSVPGESLRKKKKKNRSRLILQELDDQIAMYFHKQLVFHRLPIATSFSPLYSQTFMQSHVYEKKCHSYCTGR